VMAGLRSGVFRMNSKLLSILLVTLSLGSGCIIDHHYDGGGGPSYYNPGNVTFSWSFAGQGCANTSVSYVVVTIPGEQLQSGGQYSCLDQSGYPGITLTNFNGGTYSYTIDAYDASNTLLFTFSDSFTVNGDITVPVNLGTVGGANSYAYLNWSFANAANAPVCGSDVTKVNVTFDGDSSTTTQYNCLDGETQQGVTTPYLAAGQHSIELDAVSDSGFVYATKQASVTTSTGTPAAQSFQLNWVVGGAAIAWNFTDASHTATTDCTQVGVDTITANFQNTADSSLVYGATGDAFACSSSSNTSVYNALPPGSYRVLLNGTGPGAVYFGETQTYSATVQAGVFYSAAQAQVIALTKQ